MLFSLLPPHFSICKLPKETLIDLSQEYIFLAKTDEELSLICETSAVPRNALMQNDGWRGLRVVGELDFSLIGIIATISPPLAEGKVSILPVSTYNTDYIFVKADQLDRAIRILQDNNHTLEVMDK